MSVRHRWFRDLFGAEFRMKTISCQGGRTRQTIRYPEGRSKTTDAAAMRADGDSTPLSIAARLRDWKKEHPTAVRGHTADQSRQPAKSRPRRETASHLES